jgi:hypothetical protein
LVQKALIQVEADGKIAKEKELLVSAEAEIVNK